LPGESLCAKSNANGNCDGNCHGNCNGNAYTNGYTCAEADSYTASSANTTTTPIVPIAALLLATPKPSEGGCEAHLWHAGKLRTTRLAETRLQRSAGVTRSTN